MMSDDLIEVAELLLRPTLGKPAEANLRRATSTAYYALFHALAYNNVDMLVGWGIRSSDYWATVAPLYRMLEHGTAKAALSRKPMKEHRSWQSFAKIAAAFVDLQEQRMLADYDPKPISSLANAKQLVERARGAINELQTLSKDDRRFLAVQILAKQARASS